MAEDTLAEYLRTRAWKGGASCAVCAIPPDLLRQVEEAVAAARAIDQSPRWANIRRWLAEQGQTTISVAKLGYHFERGHHER